LNKNNHLVSLDGDETITIWDLKSSKKLSEIDISADRALALTSNPSTGIVATSHLSHIIKIWDTDKKVVTAKMDGHSEAVVSLAFSRDGKYLVSGSHDKKVVLWETKTGRKLETFVGHTKEVTSVAISVSLHGVASQRGAHW
jgi:WD40 repeat protein